MKMSKFLVVGTVVATALAATGFGVTGVTPLRVTGAATVVPPASYVGSSDADNLVGSARNDVLRGLAGNDRLRGGEGNDVLHGGPATTACWRTGSRSVLRRARERQAVGTRRQDRGRQRRPRLRPGLGRWQPMSSEALSASTVDSSGRTLRRFARVLPRADVGAGPAARSRSSSPRSTRRRRSGQGHRRGASSHPSRR